MRFPFLLSDLHGERRNSIRADNTQTDMLVAAGDNRSHIIRGKRYLGWRTGVIWADFQDHGYLEFTVGTLHTTHNTMARAIVTSPGIIIHTSIRPCAQCLYRHKIGQHDFTSSTSKLCLQDIATTEVALRSGDCFVGRAYLEVAAAFGIQQTA